MKTGKAFETRNKSKRFLDSDDNTFPNGSSFKIKIRYQKDIFGVSTTAHLVIEVLLYFTSLSDLFK